MTQLGYDVFQTDWGWIGVVGSAKGIRYCCLPEETPDAAMERLTDANPGQQMTEQPEFFEAFRQQMREYLNGNRSHWEVELDLSDATPFFQRAWAACQTIPPGETRTYSWLAEQAGRPAAARAAGQAMARNRVPLIIPCHRVIGSDGGLHGFGGGLPLKARLLDLEHANKG